MVRKTPWAATWACALLLLGLPYFDAFLVCPKQGVLYWHIPKCAGMSVEAQLRSSFGCVMYAGWLHDKRDFAHVTPDDAEEVLSVFMQQELDPCSHNDDGRTRSCPQSLSEKSANNRARDLTALMRTGVMAMVASMKSMAVVRDPYTRVLSAYGERCYNKDKAENGWGSCPPFSEYMEKLYRDGFADPSTVYFKPSTMWTHTFDGNKRVDEVVRMETLDTDFSKAQKRVFGCQHCSSLVEDYNSASRFGRAKPTHTKRTIEIVNCLYYEDFAWLGYDMRDDVTAPQGGRSPFARKEGLSHVLDDAATPAHNLRRGTCKGMSPRKGWYKFPKKFWRPSSLNQQFGNNLFTKASNFGVKWDDDSETIAKARQWFDTGNSFVLNSERENTGAGANN